MPAATKLLSAARTSTPFDVSVSASFAPVRVLQWVDDHDRLAENQVHVRVVDGSEQMVGLGERGVTRRQLVAVNGVCEPRHDWKTLEKRVGVRFGSRESACIRLYGLDTGDTIRTCNHQDVEWSTFPARRVLLEPRATRLPRAVRAGTARSERGCSARRQSRDRRRPRASGWQGHTAFQERESRAMAPPVRPASAARAQEETTLST